MFTTPLYYSHDFLHYVVVKKVLTDPSLQPQNLKIRQYDTLSSKCAGAFQYMPRHDSIIYVPEMSSHVKIEEANDQHNRRSP